MATLSATQQAFLKAQNFAVVATVGEDGSPQSTVVWIDTDGENVVFNTKRGRAKVAHLERDPRVSVTVIDAADPYALRRGAGCRVARRRGSRRAHQLPLAQVHGRGFLRTSTDRVIVRVRPDRVLTYNVD